MLKIFGRDIFYHHHRRRPLQTNGNSSETTTQKREKRKTHLNKGRVHVIERVQIRHAKIAAKHHGHLVVGCRRDAIFGAHPRRERSQPKVSYVLVASLNASDFDTRFSLSSRFAWSILTRFACSASVNSRAFLPAFSSFNSIGWHTVDASSRQTKREPECDERDALVADFDFDVPKFDDVAFAPATPPLRRFIAGKEGFYESLHDDVALFQSVSR